MSLLGTEDDPSTSTCTPGSIAADFPVSFSSLSVTSSGRYAPIALSTPCGKASVESRASADDMTENCSFMSLGADVLRQADTEVRFPAIT